MTDVDPHARQMLTDYAARHGRPLGLGHSTVAHRDLGYCAVCVREAVSKPRANGQVIDADGHPITDPEGYPSRVELAGWRLLAMAERGIPDWTPAAMKVWPQGARQGATTRSAQPMTLQPVHERGAS